MIRIVLAEDQALILGALAALLGLEPDLEIVGRAEDGDAALALVRSCKPDVLVTDVEMPRMSGIEVAATLRQERLRTAVVVVTTFGRPGYLRRALEAGVRGYLTKDGPSALLADAIRVVARGGRAIAPALSDAMWDAPPDPLTNRERSVLRLAELGRSNSDIAAALGLSPGTVRNYLSEAAQKMGVGTRGEAARIARASGWL